MQPILNYQSCILLKNVKMLIFARNISRHIYNDKILVRNYAKATTANQGKLKVALCGAAGNLGQALALILKTSPIIDELALFDLQSTNGMAIELNHIDTNCKAVSAKGKIKDALENAKIVVIAASAPKITEDPFQIFKRNACIVSDITMNATCFCPKAFMTIVTTPVNSMVPLVSEVMKKQRVFNANHIFGISNLNTMRANNICAHFQNLDPNLVNVPVIGGHTGKTIVPILSQMRPESEFTNEELIKITELVQHSCLSNGQRVVNCPMSGALAASRFVISLARAIKGEQKIIEYAYVNSNVYQGVDYLTTPIELGIDGIQRNLGLPKMTEYEKCLLHNAVNALNEDVLLGEEFVGRKAAKKRQVQALECKLSPCT